MQDCVKLNDNNDIYQAFSSKNLLLFLKNNYLF